MFFQLTNLLANIRRAVINSCEHVKTKGLYHKTLRTRNLQEIDKFHKLVSIVSHKHITLI